MLLSSVLTFALAVAGANAALHDTRSRQHAADLHVAARKVGAIAPREVALANDSKPIHKRRTQRKKRCKAHSGGSGSGSGAGTGHTGNTSGGSTSSGSGGSGSSDSDSGSGAGAPQPGMDWVGQPSSGFTGVQSDAVVSWFRSNYGGDSTNGNSWCGYPYSDDQPLFAPSLSRMGGATWSSDPEAWKAQTREWCGREAEVTWQGKTVKMFIGDAFDDAWVRTPASIDVLQPTFAKLFGHWTDNKADVMTGATWKLTGYKSKEFSSPN